MKHEQENLVGLTTAGCQRRRARLANQLEAVSVDGILVADRRHIFYLTGHWASPHHAPLLTLTADGKSHLVVAGEASGMDENSALSVSSYEAHRLGTLFDGQCEAAIRVIRDDLDAGSHWGIDLPGLVPQFRLEMVDLSAMLLQMRRAKDADEAALVQRAVRACEACYARAAEIVRPGLREIDLFAEMHATAVRAAGEPIGELGNDFQSGTPGGPPRCRAMKAGELLPLDLGVSIRGYRADLCRTFAVGGDPTDAQLQAAERVEDAMALVRERFKVGASCRQLYEEVLHAIDGFQGWKFTHHLGHGTGLSAHEAPRFNPHWDDVLMTGDLFTIEPGLYHEDLRGGVRIEENFWLAPAGLVQLSRYPTKLGG